MNPCFIFHIQTGSCLVKEDDGCVFQQSSCNRNTLPFTAGKLRPVFSDGGVVALGKPMNKLIAVGRFGRSPHFFIRCATLTKTDIFRGQSNAGGKGEKVINMISTDCDLMVKMIMFGIEHKQALQIHGVDAHAMSVFGKLLPVNGSRLFSAVMKAADIDLFKEVFKDDAELAE